MGQVQTWMVNKAEKKHLTGCQQAVYTRISSNQNIFINCINICNTDIKNNLIVLTLSDISLFVIRIGLVEKSFLQDRRLLFHVWNTSQWYKKGQGHGFPYRFR